MLRNVFFIFLTISFSITTAFAQIKLTGSITDQREPLAFCNVLLLNPDSSLLTGATSDIDGKFILQVQAGIYQLQVSYVGYKTYEQSIDLVENTDLGSILLNPSGTELGEVVVSAQKQLIERKADRLVFNVGSSIAAQGADLSKAISLAPGIVVRNNGISMLGRGNVRVMLDGRMLQLAGEELLAFLSAIPSDDIEKIEVIANPPAEYEAAGNGGMINIIYKKGRNNSWKNTSTLSHTQAREGYTTFRNSFQLNKDKHRFSLSLNGTLGENWNTEYGATFFPDATQTWESVYVGSRNGASARLAYDYQLTDATSIGFQYQGATAAPDFEAYTSSQVVFIDNTEDSTFVNETLGLRHRQSNIANIHFSTQLDSLGRSLSFDADYFSFRQTTDTDFNVNNFNPEGISTGLVRTRLALTDQIIENYSLKMDIDHPTKLINLSYGAKYNYNISKNEIENFDRLSGTPVLDTNLSNEFEYTEQILAAYVNTSRQFTDQLSLQLGLRTEYTDTKGFSKTLNKTNTNDYIRLFPTAYLSYQASENHQWSWSVGGRVNRAVFRDLNPFRTYINNTAYSEGNPFLAPSYTYTYNMDYVFKGRFTTSAYYNRTNNGFGTLFVPFAEGRVLATLRDNFHTSNNFGIGELFPVTISKRWSMQNQVYLMYNYSSLNDNYNAVAQNGFQYYVSSNNSITLPKDWKIQVNAFYSSPGQGNIFTVDAIWSVDFGIQKKLFNDKLLVSLQVNDIFDASSMERLASEINGVTNTYGQNYSNRNIQLSLSYSFGNDKINLKNRNFGNEETQNRL